MYDPNERMWIPGPKMITPRANVGVAVVGNRLYAVGGFSGNFLIYFKTCMVLVIIVSNLFNDENIIYFF